MNRKNMVERAGFEPAKALPTDLQSAPFGHSGTSPKYYGTRKLQELKNPSKTNVLPTFK